MADAKSAPQAAAEATVETAPGLLDQIITNTKQTEPDRAQELVKTLVEQALAGTVTFDRNLTRTFAKAVKAIDAKLSEQLNAIMHDPKFLKLEGSWRGLHYLVQNSETGTSLKLRVLNITKRELGRDLSRAIEFDQSQLFKKIYENEFGTPGGEPYGALIGDYEWTNHPDDLETLRLMSNIAARAFAQVGHFRSRGRSTHRTSGGGSNQGDQDREAKTLAAHQLTSTRAVCTILS